ncbi:hypothetical protein [Streptomyces sp. B21-083]|uniref:hypothetical protein n=1 Tax=Streptomyces sp. B21-083 TaxID=3039410 RepID=UPI002FF1B169
MTDPLRPPPPAAARLRPFAHDPARWDAARARALHAEQIAYETGAPAEAGEPHLVHERTGWGWLAWTVPDDGSMPEHPYRIGVLPPSATQTDRLAGRWLARRQASRFALHARIPGSLSHCATVVAVIACITAFHAITHGVPLSVVLPAALLAPLLTDQLPGRLDTRARRRIRIAEGAPATRYLQRLAALHNSVLQAAASSDRYELRRSAEVGHNLLWDAAGLLRTQDTRTVSGDLIARERLMLQLADQVAQIIERSTSDDDAADADQIRAPRRPMGSYPPRVRPMTSAASRSAHSTSLVKGNLRMSEPEPRPVFRTPDVYLLFAHEAYYPGSATQEINVTVVAAGSLLHPQVCQPDGARIHDLLTQGRQPGEIVPLATLTHELGGGADWPAVGDWERVTTDLLHLVRLGDCDALSLGLPEIARALLCTGPHSHVRAYDASAQDFVDYGPAHRAAVLDEVDAFLAGLVAEQELWPGDDLLAPITRTA